MAKKRLVCNEMQWFSRETRGGPARRDNSDTFAFAHSRAFLVIQNINKHVILSGAKDLPQAMDHALDRPCATSPIVGSLAPLGMTARSSRRVQTNICRMFQVFRDPIGATATGHFVKAGEHADRTHAGV